MSLTAQAALPVLFRALDRAEWAGPAGLGGYELQGVRTTLRALASLINERTGEGFTTAPQVAASAQLSERWVRRCLAVLEDLGVVVWRRGGASHGQPVPSHFRVVKRVLVDLVRAGRAMRDAALPARWAEVRARIAAARFAKTPRYRRSGPPPELSAGSTPLTGEGPAAPAPRGEETPVRPLIPITCPHDGDAGVLKNGLPRCPMCRRTQETRTAPKTVDVAALVPNDPDLLDGLT